MQSNGHVGNQPTRLGTPLLGQWNRNAQRLVFDLRNPTGCPLRFGDGKLGDLSNPMHVGKERSPRIDALCNVSLLFSPYSPPILQSIEDEGTTHRKKCSVDSQDSGDQGLEIIEPTRRST